MWSETTKDWLLSNRRFKANVNNLGPQEIKISHCNTYWAYGFCYTKGLSLYPLLSRLAFKSGES
jgi:hypothetical protein